MDKLITIKRFDNEFEAELAHALLENVGIEAFIQNEHILSMIPGIASNKLELELQVRQSDSEMATQVLAAASSSTDPLQVLKNESAFLEGHFLLTSGLHSSGYVEKMRVLQNPAAARVLCAHMAQTLDMYEPDAFVGPAYGGIALAFEVAAILNADFFFTQRKDGRMAIRSGFDLSEIKQVVVVEDIVTTGGSVMEVMECLRERGIEVMAVAAIVDRSSGKADFGVPFHSLVTLDIPVFQADNCPLCRTGVPLVKPGSSDKPGI